MSFIPRVVAFCCNWCAYAGADLAGVSRCQYTPETRVVRVMCSSRVDPAMVLRCYELGADGVMVLGCHIGDCHYMKGNEEAERRMERTQEIMQLLGIDERRLLLRWISASEGERFAQTANTFVSTLRELGPLRGDIDED
ncbi:MAG TPA: hydrogenase iron-sulfur subunit [Methanomassiliicoccales archaeon]|nr:hydrogenase iron-sulfur subunit [Methanomassiliicoccales archaeon]